MFEYIRDANIFFAFILVWDSSKCWLFSYILRKKKSLCSEWQKSFIMNHSLWLLDRFFVHTKIKLDEFSGFHECRLLNIEDYCLTFSPKWPKNLGLCSVLCYLSFSLCFYLMKSRYWYFHSIYKTDNFRSTQKNEFLNKIILMLGISFKKSVKIKPKLTFFIHGFWFVPQSIAIIDDENSRKSTDSMKIQFSIWYSD
jgi:hypothetical protein